MTLNLLVHIERLHATRRIQEILALNGTMRIPIGYEIVGRHPDAYVCSMGAKR